MRSTHRSLAASASLLLAAVAAQASGNVQVSFVQPEKFTDARDARRDDAVNLRELKRYLEDLGARHVTDGQSLIIEVLDVDLAGDVIYSRRLRDDVRVLKGRADWPRITFRATLETPGQPLRRFEQTVSDMAYLQRINRYRDGELLSHEKRMLDEWFEAQFAGAAAK
jgi:Protein of unknown function (DUF3016)